MAEDSTKIEAQIKKFKRECRKTLREALVDKFEAGFRLGLRVGRELERVSAKQWRQN